jgi:hypothetical protein
VKLTEAAFAAQWPLAGHLVKVTAAREAAEDKGSWTAVSSMLRQEGELVAQRAADYAAHCADEDRALDQGDLVAATARKILGLPDAVQDEILTALGW